MVDAIAGPDEWARDGLLDGVGHRRQHGLIDLANGGVSAPVGLLRGHDVRRFREGRFAQIHDHELGAERLAGVPGRTL